MTPLRRLSARCNRLPLNCSGVPEVFAQLRPEIDAQCRPGRFLLLGSASGQLLRQSSESLAGRASYRELTPLQMHEVVDPKLGPQTTMEALQKLWLRGGFPVS